MFYPRYTGYSRSTRNICPGGMSGWRPPSRSWSGGPLRRVLPVYNYHDRWDKLTLKDLTVPFFGARRQTGGVHVSKRRQGHGGEVDGTCPTRTTDESKLCPENRGLLPGKRHKLRVLAGAGVSASVPGQDRRSGGRPGALDVPVWMPDRDRYDPQTQWYDDLHLNSSGAQILSRELARRIDADGLAVPSEGYDDLWQARWEYFLALEDSIK